METLETQNAVRSPARVRLPRAMPRNRRVQLVAAGLILLVVVIVVTLLPPRVVVTQLTAAKIRDEAAGTGFVRAKVTIGVGAKINGIVLKTYVDQGDAVRKGQVLAELQNQDVQSQVGQAENIAQAQQADLGAARANLSASRARLAASRTAVGKSQAGLKLTEINYQRAKSLYAEGVWAKDALDTAETAYLQAQEDVRNSQALETSAEEDVSAAEASVAAAEKNVAGSDAAVRLQRANLQYTIITSPVDGYVVTRDLEQGATVVPGLSIFTIAAQSSPIWASVNIDEREIDGLKVGQPATIALRSAPSRRIPGIVARIARQADPVTEEVVVDVAFVHQPPDLKLNETAEVYILKGEKSGAKVLPRTAIVEGKQGPMVWVAAEGRLQSRPVSLGLRDKRGLVEITDGVSDSDRVLVQPSAAGIPLTPGRRVRASLVRTGVSE
jgi:RND family efflux transporter MFP subunit